MGTAATIYVLTVHWQSARWIEIQHRFLNRFLTGEQKRLAFLTGIDDRFGEFFDSAEQTSLGSHAKKLNLLAERALETAEDNDILLFLDGDAFPIAPLDKALHEWLGQQPMAAVQRLENNGDPQPHPCFCVTRAGFWRDIEGDWRQGHRWINNTGESVTDVGGRLMRKLESRQQSWMPLLRSNQHNLHPLWFGIYGDLIYHHGAGFRSAVSRADLARHMNALDRMMDKIRLKLPLSERFQGIRDRLDPIPRYSERIQQENQQLMASIYQQIIEDPDFYQQFMA